jgi:hypothetical protein
VSFGRPGLKQTKTFWTVLKSPQTADRPCLVSSERSNIDTDKKAINLSDWVFHASTRLSRLSKDSLQKTLWSKFILQLSCVGTKN